MLVRVHSRSSPSVIKDEGDCQTSEAGLRPAHSIFSGSGQGSGQGEDGGLSGQRWAGRNAGRVMGHGGTSGKGVEQLLGGCYQAGVRGNMASEVVAGR